MLVLLRIIVKEFLQLRRDRKMIPIVFVAPIFQLLALGYAANLDVTDIPLLVVDRDRTAASRELVDRFTASGHFRLVASETALEGVEPWLLTGRAQLALVIDEEFGNRLAVGEGTRVQLIADGSDSVSSGIGLGYATGVVGDANADILARRRVSRAPPASGDRPQLPPARVDLVTRVWYNPDLVSRWYYVPAVLALVLMVMTMVLSAMGVVREKEIGTLEQVMVTPVRSWQLIVGKLLPFAVIGLIDIFLVTAVAVFWFRVPLRGSFALLVGLTLLFLLNTLGLGLLVSTVARNQQQAMMTAAFVLMLPMIFLSGLIFPIENMPRPFQLATYAIPLRYYAEILRGIFLKGSGPAVLWPQALALAAFGLSFLTLASLRFRKRVD